MTEYFRKCVNAECTQGRVPVMVRDGDFDFHRCPTCKGEGYVPVDAVDEISDGYHTFAELYEHRHALFAALCRAYGHAAWKSRLHADGTMFDGGWFIAGIALPTGMITYHLPEKWWGLVDAQEWDLAPEWDGHTAEDVVNRIAASLVLHEETK